MTRGRRPNTEPSTERTFQIRESIDTQVHLLLYDPHKKRIRYGAYSALVNQLLASWLGEKGKK